MSTSSHFHFRETASPELPFFRAKVENVTIGTGDYMFPRPRLELWTTVDVFCCGNGVPSWSPVGGGRSLQQGQFRSVWEQLTAQGGGIDRQSLFLIQRVTLGTSRPILKRVSEVLPNRVSGRVFFWNRVFS